jgi:putative addiction module component (TIGR02574 family)
VLRSATPAIAVARGDDVVCLGAGNITQWAYALPGEFESREVGRVASEAVRDYSVAMNKALRDQVLQLSVAEKLDLIGEIWDSIPPNAEEFDLTPEQMQELDRRMAEHERDPSSAIPWEEVRERLRARFG